MLSSIGFLTIFGSIFEGFWMCFVVVFLQRCGVADNNANFQKWAFRGGAASVLVYEALALTLEKAV